MSRSILKKNHYPSNSDIDLILAKAEIKVLNFSQDYEGIQAWVLKASTRFRVLISKDKSRNTDPSLAVTGFTWFWEGLDHYLASKGLKQTTQRKVIVEHFLRLNSHVDADELHQSVREEGHDIGLATIYRTLNLLRDAGLVDQQSFQDGRHVYEVASPNSHHDHLVCTSCGVVIEFEDPEIERLQEKIAVKYAMVLKSHRLDLYGTCLDEAACKLRRASQKVPS